MVYKKYIYRKGKKFGPYYYESYRENGKVKTRFVSGPKKSDKVIEKIQIRKETFIFFVILFLIILLTAGIINFVKELKIYQEGVLLSPYESAVEPESRQEEVDYDVESAIEESFEQSTGIEEETEKMLESKKKIKIEKLPDGSLKIYDVSDELEKKLVAELRLTMVDGVKKLDIFFS